MPENDPPSAIASDTPASDTPRQLTPAAIRALEEAAERRRQRAHAAKAEAEIAGSEGNQPKELGGRKGPDPVRYGDWENGGIASDF